MMKKIIFSALVLILSLLIPSAAVSACGSYHYLDKSKPYDTLTPTSVQLVYAEARKDAGHVGAPRASFGWPATTFQSLQNFIETSEELYHTDSKLDDLPTIKEQCAVYNEEFFDDYILFIWM